MRSRSHLSYYLSVIHSLVLGTTPVHVQVHQYFLSITGSRGSAATLACTTRERGVAAKTASRGGGLFFFFLSSSTAFCLSFFAFDTTHPSTGLFFLINPKYMIDSLYTTLRLLPFGRRTGVFAASGLSFFLPSTLMFSYNFQRDLSGVFKFFYRPVQTLSALLSN